MRDRIYIIVEKPCHECYGYGIVEHNAWRYFYKKYGNKVMTEEEIKKIFNNMGYEEIPPEMVDCIVCKGKGVNPYRIELDDLIQLIKERLAEL